MGGVSPEDGSLTGWSAAPPQGPPRAGSHTRWSWHLVNWKFFGMASEACDGTPAIVEQNVQNWIQTHRNAAFCPWSSYVSACASANCVDLPPIQPQNAEYLVTLEMNSTQP